MQVFKISGKFEQNSKWSCRDADFIGYFTRSEGDGVIEGYIEEQFPTRYDPIRYIKGLFTDSNQLIFMKMCNDGNLSPLVYSFPNLNEQGYWSAFHHIGGFFHNGSYEGHSTVELEEITSEDEKREIKQKVITIFAEKTSKATPLNRDLLYDAKSLIDFLDEESEWYPKK